MDQSVNGQREDEIQRVRRTRTQIAQRRIKEWNGRLLAAIRDGQLGPGDLDCSEAVIERIREARHLSLIVEMPRLLVTVPPRTWEEGIARALAHNEAEWELLDRTPVEQLAWDLVQILGQCANRCPMEVALMTKLSLQHIASFGLADFRVLSHEIAASGMSLRRGNNLAWWDHILNLSEALEMSETPELDGCLKELPQFLLINE